MAKENFIAHTNFISLFFASVALLAVGANIEATEEDGWTPLHLAAQDGEVNAVMVLIQNHTNLRVRAQDGRTAFPIASDCGTTDVVSAMLLHYGLI